ncbi:MAG: division/cell wall cluster transcriptional repressor MraZ [Clostridia bacterium]|nr:division/cell wall cluster transcriptional repressor MraZ [Clostridia bacterium]
MLIGEYQHNIDAKGRVAVPTKFRDDLGMRFYITKGLDGCLFVLQQNEWEKLEEKVRQLPISKARTIQRFFFSGAAEVQPDKQGRILIPQPLRDHASLTKEVTFIGTSNRVEIWDSDRWTSFNSAITEDSIEEAMDFLEL